jgi:DNA-binding ferritin-like protein
MYIYMYIYIYTYKIVNYNIIFEYYIMSTNRHRNRNKTRNRNRSGGTRKKDPRSSSLSSFQKEITIIFLEMLLMVKLYHWKTTSYATHKATDELYTKLNANIDEFIEILLGKSGSRIELMNNKNIRLVDLSSQERLKREIETFKGYLVSLDENNAMRSMSNTDLYNIRDTILGDLNQFLYLLTFK